MSALPYKLLKQNANTLTPIDIYRNLPGGKKFLLESTFQHEKKGKYSFIGSDPYEEVIGHSNETTKINSETEEKEYFHKNALTYIQENFSKLDLNIPLPFYGGAVGYVGYDAIREHENIGEKLPDEVNMPDIHFMMYNNIIVFDHSHQVIYLIAINTKQQSEKELDERLHHLSNALCKREETIGNQNTISFESQITKEAFMEKVRTAKEYIQQGDIFQVVLSQRMAADMEGDPFHFYQKLREANPSPYMFYINFEDYLLLGASPESLVQTQGDVVITNPIAGTRARGKTPEEDEMLMNELLQDEKEIAEHRMLIDLSRNDLGRVCEIGSVTIPTYMEVEKYQHVMHIVSEVKGTLKKKHTSMDALVSCLPAGTVSGAPKIRAMQIINELEEKKRGAYAGGIGFINYNHDINIALAIRSLVIKNKKAYLQAGAGIVFDSDPELEYQETLNKAKSLMEVSKYDLVN
ncbi:anthranilate synthase component I [Oceanobacillus halophilus]|uniref:Anthranilate synthase component 1 n=1 Tax=Oceanobacillus halophilus TaxID=930130 RepID=A0A495A2N5_9BACI|nr:anthranilate synthase component I [Oceanobacillus halophilus]RKQ33206.1 anthranilate synthase component I [Oceanobacillus halophilus]